jgi:hypothetical protein
MVFNTGEMIEDKNSMRDRVRHELACLIAEAPMISQAHLEGAHAIRQTLPGEVSPADRQKTRGFEK